MDERDCRCRHNESGKKTLLSFTPVRHCPALSFEPSWKHEPRRLTCVHLVNGMNMSLEPSAKASNVCAMCFSNLVGRVSKSVSSSSTRGKNVSAQWKWMFGFVNLSVSKHIPRCRTCAQVFESISLASTLWKWMLGCITRRSQKRKREKGNEGERETDTPRFLHKLTHTITAFEIPNLSKKTLYEQKWFWN